MASTLRALAAGTLLLGAGAAAQTYAAPAHHSTHLHRTVKAIAGGQSYIFSPKKITVKVGTKVTWKNQSTAPHTVTSKGSTLFNKSLATSGTVSYVFKKAGTFHYYCMFHPGMVGTVVVK